MISFFFRSFLFGPPLFINKLEDCNTGFTVSMDEHGRMDSFLKTVQFILMIKILLVCV